MPDFGTGLLVEAPDERDALYGAFEDLLGAYPTSFTLDRLPFVRNQGNKNSCVYQTIARITDYANRLENDPSQVSARYGFAYCKLWDGYPTLEGTFFKTGLDVAQKVGTSLSLRWPDVTDIPYAEYIQRPSPEADNSAKPFKIKDYVSLRSPNEVKDYLMKYKLPILIGINSNNTGWGNQVVASHQNVLQEPTGGRLGHAVACVGWNEVGWVFDNSWSEFWGDQGRATVPYNYTGLQSTMYGVYDLPNGWETQNETYKDMVTKENINGILFSLSGNTENWADATVVAEALNKGDQNKVNEIMAKYKTTSNADQKITQIKNILAN